MRRFLSTFMVYFAKIYCITTRRCFHGLLHLLGYDHMVEEDKVVMRAREEATLRELDLSEEFFGG